MWLFGGGPPKAFSWVYQYHPGRGSHIPRAFFQDFEGGLHIDGYAGYVGMPQVPLTGCFAHARRKFFDVAQSSKKKR